MRAFARQLATVLIAGPWNHNAMVARLVRAFDGERPWMQRLVAGVLSEPDDESDEDSADDAIPPYDRWDDNPWLAEYDDFARNDTIEGDAALHELTIRVISVRAFYAAVLERPLERGWSAPPSMRESRWCVPALATTKELSVWFGVSHDALTALADVRNISRNARDERRRHYRYTWLAKRGGYRLLEAPKPRLRRLQRHVLDDIVAHIPPHPAAHGFRRDHSILTSARTHVGKPVVIRLDLEAFFTSVFDTRVAAIFYAAGYPQNVAKTLAALCTHRTPTAVIRAKPTTAGNDRARPAGAGNDRIRLRTRHLPQGAPTSGALANLAGFGFDVRVNALATSIGADYTRYADDIAISGGRDLVRAAPTLIARVGAIAFEEGFTLNFRKTRVMTASGRQRLTGLTLNDKLAVPRGELERLRAILHNCTRSGPAAQNRDGHADFRAHLLGRIAWVASIDPAKADRLRAIFERIAWVER